VNASFYVVNQGEPGSELDWEIEYLPSWGDWTVTPMSFSGLMPEDDPLLVTVKVTIPERKKHTFTGGIILVNQHAPSDKASIPISITTQRSYSSLFTPTHPLFFDLFSFWIHPITY
jgi:hypothetical protein